MSQLKISDRRLLEQCFGMSTGYVLDFSDRTFGEFVEEHVGLNIHDKKYTLDGSSKANKLRTFWKIEADPIAGKLILALYEHAQMIEPPRDRERALLLGQVKVVAERLLTGAPTLEPLKTRADKLDGDHLRAQIRRMSDAVETDPCLAIGTAKELIETCCKTILANRGRSIDDDELPALTKATLKELKLVPEGIPESTRGADIIKRMLNNLGTIGIGLAELRNLYGTGHGQHAKSTGLRPRHARLAVGAAAALATFLFETHIETMPRTNAPMALPMSGKK